VLGSDIEWHFAHRGLPHARPRRSIAHTRLLKQNPLVHTAVQQTGFKRVKRGYRPFRLSDSIPAAVKRGFRPLSLPETRPASEPRDPYFPLQWYLKNTGQNGGKPNHGTRCAGEVAAARDNGVCGVGVAYHSKVAVSKSNFLFDFCFLLNNKETLRQIRQEYIIGESRII
ncbi:putative neuroendocrine convertase, partial [Operophtera brumata]